MRVNGVNEKIGRITKDTLICGIDIGKTNCCARFCDYRGMEVYKKVWFDRTKNLDVIAKNDINILLKNDVDIDSLDKNIEIYNNPSAPVSEGAVLGKISYTINDKTYSTDLIAANSVEATSFELIIFRIALIFLILYLFTAIFKKINNFGNKNKSKKNNIHKSIKKSKKRKSKTGGKFKFTQINEYL